MPIPKPLIPKPKAHPSVMDVAARAGVSRGTVSNVLNHPQKVNPVTLSKVQQAIEQLGFVPDNNARVLAVGQNSSIGIVVSALDSSFFIEIARGAQDEARKSGKQVLLTDSNDDKELQDLHLNYFDAARVSGVLIAPMIDSAVAIARIRSHGRPVVVLNFRPGNDDGCCVLVDNEQAGYLAARHLIELGRTRLLFVSGSDQLQPVRDRRIGIERALAEAGGAVSFEEIETEDIRAQGGRRVGAALVRRAPADRPDGIIAVTDLIGMAIVESFSESGIAVPHDIAVMGCDFNSFAWGDAIPLTTVRMRGYELGVEGVRLLLEEADPESAHEHRTVVLEPELVARESTLGR